MADDIPQDQTQTEPPTQPTPENPVVSETPDIPNPPNSPNPEPIAPATPEPQTQPAETKTETTVPIEPEQTPLVPTAPVLGIPTLHYPFSGNFPVTFSYGQQSDNEEIKKKFQEWGIVGHNGLDFGLSAGNEVFACDSGKVIQAGDNGDFGTSVTILHSWGQSIYGHLQETKVKENDEVKVNQVIGLSGSSGAAFGEHLHFAIKPNDPDPNNGYLGFVDPAPYLSLQSQKEEQKPPEENKPPETTQPVQEPPKTEETQQPPVEEAPPPIKLEPERPVEQTEQPQSPKIPQSPQVPQVSEEEIQKQVDEKFKTELDLRRQKANETRSQKKEDHLTKIFDLVRDKKVVTNEDVRDFLHVSQSTATNYLTEMVNRGVLKKEGERGGAKYSI
jgi:ribosomal protein S25